MYMYLLVAWYSTDLQVLTSAVAKMEASLSPAVVASFVSGEAYICSCVNCLWMGVNCLLKGVGMGVAQLERT